MSITMKSIEHGIFKGPLKIPDPVPTKLGKANLHYVDLKQNKATDQTLIFSEEARSIFPEMVIRHTLTLETSEVVYGAREYLYNKDVGSAVELLNRQVDRFKETSRLTDGTELAEDRVTLKKLSSLAKNLGLPRQSSDMGQVFSYPAIHMMNTFAQARNGHIRAKTMRVGAQP